MPFSKNLNSKNTQNALSPPKCYKYATPAICEKVAIFIKITKSQLDLN